MKTKVLFFVFLFTISYFALCQNPSKYAVYENLPECDYDNIIMPVTPEEQAYLVYFDYFNIFDSIFVQNTIGEFSILNSNDETIKLLFFINAFNLLEGLGKIWGSNAVGTDSILTQISRTIPFTYPPNSKIRFFRFVQLGIPCGKWREPESEDVFQNWWEKARLAIPNSILDTSVWVIQLVRLSDNLILHTLDSLVVFPNGNSWIAPIVGHEPNKSTHIVDLPNQYANDSVYIRVEVRRYGPTPYGMKLTTSYVPAIYPLSLVYDYGPNNESQYTVKCNLNFDTLAKIFFSRLVNYFELVKNSNNGTIYESILSFRYNLLTLEDVSENLADSLRKMYNISRFNKEVTHDTLALPNFEILQNRKLFIHQTNIVSLGNNNYLLRLKINCRMNDLDGQIAVYDLQGRLLKDIKSVHFAKGLNTIEIPLENMNTRFVNILVIPKIEEPYSSAKVILN